MIESVSSLLSYKMQNQRDLMSVSLMKQKAAAEQAMAQMIMESAQNVQALTQSSAAGSVGGIVNIYA